MTFGKAALLLEVPERLGDAEISAVMNSSIANSYLSVASRRSCEVRGLCKHAAESRSSGAKA